MEARFAGPARAATFAAVLTLVFGAFSLPLVSPPLVQAAAPLPACRYDDLLTSPRQYEDWSTTLVDTILRVPGTYEPPDLVPVTRAGFEGQGLVRSFVIDDLRAMREAAEAAGAAIGVQSAYRTYERQQEVFAEYVADLGRARALRVSARPGHSEHQLGLGIDFRSHPGGTPFEGDWDTTPAGKWMKVHSWEFGFVLSYPKGKRNVVCYDFEPWHFRYVGRELAAQVHGSGMTLREYLWANFTTAIVPASSPGPGFTAGPSASPDPFASAFPSAGPSLETSPGPSSSVDPSAPVTGSPSPPAGASPPASAVPSPGAPPPAEGPATIHLDGPIALGTVLALGSLVALAWMVLRRGRARVGL